MKQVRQVSMVDLAVAERTRVTLSPKQLKEEMEHMLRKARKRRSVEEKSASGFERDETEGEANLTWRARVARREESRRLGARVGRRQSTSSWLRRSSGGWAWRRRW